MSGVFSTTARRTVRRSILALIALATATMFVPNPASGVAFITDSSRELDNLDARVGTVAPTSAQLAMVSSLGASRVSWNRFGTPRSLIKWGGYLATGLSGDAVQVARSFIDSNKALFRLSDAGVANLELVNDSEMAGSEGHTVLFRQTFGGLPATQDGLITVGVVGDKVAYASSSSAGDGNDPGSALLSPTAAWLAAASSVGRNVSASDISNAKNSFGWRVFSVAGFAQPQRARLVALPTPTQGVKAAYEVNVVDVKGAEAIAYTIFVDARSGDVLVRNNRVDHFALAAPTSGTFSGSTAANPPCGPLHEFEVPAGTKSVDVVASAVNPADDIVLNLHHPPGSVVASADTATSPEAIHYAPAILDPGTYAAEVCQFEPDVPPFEYVGAYFTNDTATAAFPYPPKWRAFPNVPRLDYSSTDTRELWCWVSQVDGTPVPGCDRALQNLAARAPWDYDVRANVPTFTTKGNSAISGEAWLSPLTPAEQYRPVSLERNYDFPWTNQWKETGCSPTVFASPERNDIDAATTNLFAMHNRMHDWSYFLGFTEDNFNLQDSNFGNGNPGPYPGGREADPEIGNSQAGAVTGGFPDFLGRDNANQITLQDGIPGITNMYLWQAIPAGFYPPCVDGDYDMSVIGHEYTHAISNRMVGGPDAGLTSSVNGQARAMGESYSDLAAVEYLQEYGFAPVDGENPYAVGPYVTQNKEEGIRNYAMNRSPLNYSDIQGYDPAGDGGPHEDGEIWSAANFDIRSLLLKKYNADFPGGRADLQRDCADGKISAERCPGNRRWIQIMFDAFLLMAPDVDMLDSRDAYLAADMMRFNGQNQNELWQGFAYRGMGQDAFSDGTEDPQPTPNFQSPVSTDEAQVTFKAVAGEGSPPEPIKATVFVGDYHANVTPVADTDPSTPLPSKVRFVPGVYDFRVQAEGYGIIGFAQKFTASQTRTVTAIMPSNWASLANGAQATGDGVNQDKMIDEDEGTNWASLGRRVNGRQVTVELAGGAHIVRHIHVSAAIRPADADDPNDPDSQSRFSALRSFELWVCSTEAPGQPTCENDADYVKIYTSSPDFFPGGAPRPLAPDWNLRHFSVRKVVATHVRLVVLTNQCTGGPVYQGEQDNDPTFTTDCPNGSDEDMIVRAAELEVFSKSHTLSVT